MFTVNVFSYLYKYLYKGPDTAFFAVNDIIPGSDGPTLVNEINDYQKGRYLSAPEACWRILEFEVTRKEPMVESLLIHLPGRNVPQFQQHDGVRSSTSLLQRYFLHAEELSHLRYKDYYEQFVLYPYHDEDELQDRDHLEKPCHRVVRKKASRRVHIDMVTLWDVHHPWAGKPPFSSHMWTTPMCSLCIPAFLEFRSMRPSTGDPDINCGNSGNHRTTFGHHSYPPRTSHVIS